MICVRGVVAVVHLLDLFMHIHMSSLFSSFSVSFTKRKPHNQDKFVIYACENVYSIYGWLAVYATFSPYHVCFIRMVFSPCHVCFIKMVFSSCHECIIEKWDNTDYIIFNVIYWFGVTYIIFTIEVKTNDYVSDYI